MPLKAADVWSGRLRGGHTSTGSRGGLTPSPAQAPAYNGQAMPKLTPLLVLVAFALSGFTFGHANAQSPTPTVPPLVPICKDAPPNAPVCYSVVADFIGPYGDASEQPRDPAGALLVVGATAIVVGTAALTLVRRL